MTTGGATNTRFNMYVPETSLGVTTGTLYMKRYLHIHRVPTTRGDVPSSSALTTNGDTNQHVQQLNCYNECGLIL